MTRTFALALLATGLSSFAVQAQMPGSLNNPVSAGTYKIDSRHTQAIFEVSHFGFSQFYGVIPNAKGTLMLDPAKPAADMLDVVLPVADLSTTNTTLDGELKDPTWLDAAKYPEIHFTATKVTQTGPHAAHIVGNLTMHGVTKPIALDAKFTGAGNNPMTKETTVGFSATGMIKRSEFGVTKYAPAVIGDDVKLTITAAFTKQG